MRLLIADDHQLVRETLCGYLDQQPDLEVLTGGDVPEALLLIATRGPFDLALVDYHMPGMEGLSGLHTLLEVPDAPPIVLMSGMVTHDVIQRAFEMGIRGFVHKSMAPASLLNAIRFMALGERFVPVDVLTSVPGQIAPVSTRDSGGARLTPRETEVMRALCNGQTNKEIARDLHLTEPTVKLHVKTLYRRLGVSNRTQAAMVARSLGMC